MNEWQFTDPASKENLLRVIRAEADGVLELVSDPAVWEGPTAAGHWQVRDIVGHLVDGAEDYLARFAHGAEPMSEPLGLAVMAKEEDRAALAYRGTDRAELVSRLARAVDAIIAELQGLTDEQWTGELISHKFMGPLPKGFYAIFQLVDYAVHAWDIREGSGRPHVLDGDAADLLVPMAFLLWQSTADCTSVEPFQLGLRVGGRNGGETVASVTPDGIEFQPGDTSACAATIDFDPASFVLTAEGRINGGTLHGDREAADRFGCLFFRI